MYKAGSLHKFLQPVTLVLNYVFFFSFRLGVAVVVDWTCIAWRKTRSVRFLRDKLMCKSDTGNAVTHGISRCAATWSYGWKVLPFLEFTAVWKRFMMVLCCEGAECQETLLRAPELLNRRPRRRWSHLSVHERIWGGGGEMNSVHTSHKGHKFKRKLRILF
jgi:hypothetical protein